MNRVDFQIDDSTFPLRLGSPLKTPDVQLDGEGWGQWGITYCNVQEERGLVRRSDELYAAEWDGGSPKQMEYVIEATRGMEYRGKAYGDILRDYVADSIASYVRDVDEYVDLLDIGAGVSTVRIFDAISDNDKDKVRVSMLEPSKERLELSGQSLIDRGLELEKTLFMYQGTDLDIPDYFDVASMDVVSYVAVLHHHASLRHPLFNVHGVLRRMGRLVVGDWHSAMWSHPNRVYMFLESLDAEELDWERKECDLEAFREAYPKAMNTARVLDARTEDANQKIREFWKNWMKVRAEAKNRGVFEERDDIFMLEAHRPVEEYVKHFGTADFSVDSVEYHLADSGLLATTVVVKV